MAEPNPYATPKAHIADPAPADSGEFISRGRAMPAGHGWKWITDGWALFRRQPLMMVAAGVVYLVIMFVTPQLIPIVGSIAAALLLPLIMAGIYSGCRALSRHSRFEFQHLLAGFRGNAGTLLRFGVLLNVLAFLAALPGGAVIGFLAAIGMFDVEAISRIQDWESAMQVFQEVWVAITLGVLVFAMLLLPVVMASWFAPILIMFHGMGARAAMKSSFIGCLKNFVPYLLYGLIYMVCLLVALLPVGLGLLILGPLFFGSIYASYREIYFTR